MESPSLLRWGDGSFTIAGDGQDGTRLPLAGRLSYVGKHHLRFAGSKEYFLKRTRLAETLLAYSDFDKHPLRQVASQDWEPHLGDWRSGDPDLAGRQRQGPYRCLNYLAGKGVNAFLSSPTMPRRWRQRLPFIEPTPDGTTTARSSTNGASSSITLPRWACISHFKLQENESDEQRLGGPKRTGKKYPRALDGGKLGIERKLYCREMIARYGHALALNWNIGEENTRAPRGGARYGDIPPDTDPYKHHIVLHTFPPEQEMVYEPLLGEKSLLTGVSLHNSWKAAHEKTLQWIS